MFVIVTAGALISSACISNEQKPKAPSEPQNLSATAGDGYISLSWQAPRDNGGAAIQYYRIYCSSSFLTQVDAKTFSILDTGLQNGIRYTYQVSAVNSAGEGPKSNMASATPITVTAGIVFNENLRLPEYHQGLRDVVVQNDSVTYKYYSDPGTLNYTAGDIIAGATGLGYLRKVVDVQQTGNLVKVQTTNASLTEAIRHGKLQAQKYLSPTGRSFSGPVWNIDLARTIYDADGITVDIVGNAKMSVNLIFNFEIKDWKLHNLSFIIETEEEVSLGIEATKGIELSKEATVYSVTLSPMTLFIGPLPIVLVPRFDFGVGVDVNFEATLSTSISFTQTTRTGIEYRNNKWTPVSEQTKQTTFSPPELSLSADARAYACIPEFQLLVYGVVGPTAELQPYLRLHASPSEDPWWALYFGLCGNAGMELEILDRKIADISFEIFDFEWEIARASNESPDQEIKYMFQEDFEKYDAGTFPSSGGWEIVHNGKGDDYQYVSDSFSKSPTKSFHLWGQKGWSCNVRKKFTTDAEAIGFEFAIMLGNRTSGADHPGFYKKGAEGQTWGTYYASVNFNHIDGKIMSEDDTILGDWVPKRWYKIKTILDRPSKTYSVWVDGLLKGSDMGIDMKQPELIDAISLIAGHPGVEVYYDDVKVFEYITGKAPPSAPQNLQASAGDGQITLGWNPPLSDGGSPITKYRVYRGLTSGGATYLKEVGDVLTFTDTGLSNGQTYYYQLSAVNAVGEGPRSNQASARPQSVDAPSTITPIWWRTWGGSEGDYAGSITVGGTSLYVVGRTQSYDANWADALVLKYDLNGNLLWNRTWNGGDHSQNHADSIALDGTSLYAAGGTDSFDSNGNDYSEDDALLLKYDTNGNLLWYKTWGGSGNEVATSIVVGSTNIYIAGYTESFGAGKNDAFLLKYTLNGDLGWYKTWGGSNDDKASSLKLDGTNIYVCGFTESYGAGGSDAFIQKYDQDGNQIWYKTWGGSDYDGASSLAVSNAKIYITGTTGYTESAGAGLPDVFLQEYDSDGNLLWTKTWGGSDHDYATSMAIDNTHIYITGLTYSYGAGRFDSFILKFDLNGDLIWDRTWGGEESDEASSLAIDTSNIYMAGRTFSFGAGSNDIFLLKTDKTNGGG